MSLIDFELKNGNIYGVQPKHLELFQILPLYPTKREHFTILSGKLVLGKTRKEWQKVSRDPWFMSWRSIWFISCRSIYSVFVYRRGHFIFYDLIFRHFDSRTGNILIILSISGDYSSAFKIYSILLASFFSLFFFFNHFILQPLK